MNAIFRNIKRAIVCITLLIGVVGSVETRAQSLYRLFTTENRLSNSLINDIVQDATGFVWIATEDGLNRFDGQDMRRYPMGYVHTMFQSVDGALYAGTIDGLYSYNPKEDGFEKINLTSDGKSQAHVTDIANDSKGNIYIATSGIGLRRLMPKQDETKVKSMLPEIGDYISSLKIYNNTLYAVATTGFFRYDITSDKLEQIEVSRELSENAFVEIINGEVYLASGGLYRLDSRAVVLREIELPTKAYVSALGSDENGTLYIGTDGQGLITYDPYLNTIVDNTTIRNNIANLQNKKIHSILFDHQNNLWLGLFQKGVMFIPRSRSLFKTTLTDVCASSICVDSQQNIHIGLDGDGETIMGMLALQNGRILKAAYDNGLVEGDNTIIKCRAICITLANDDIWLGTYGSGIIRLDKELNIKSNYVSTSESVDTTRNEVINNYINCLVQLGDMLYIGTYKGLSCYDLKKETFRVLPRKLREAIGTKVVCHVDRIYTRLYVATNQGLIEYDQATDEVNTLTTKDGLPSDVIVALNHDGKSNLWAATHSGLLFYDTNRKQMLTYYSHDGLQGNQFSRAATLCMKNGDIYFAGTNGISGFSPENVTESLSTQTGITDTIKVTDLFVGRDECRVTLTTFNFTNPELIVYDYQLLGLDDTWHSTQQGTSQLTFNNLRHGDYVLNVNAKLGGKNFAVLTLPITIDPQWYQTWWAKVLYVLIIIVIIALIFLATRQQQRIRHEMLLQEQQRDIEEAKFQFFFNISHEIRTPLTLILNPIKELISSQKETADNNTLMRYDMILRNSQRILHLINQLLDLRKIEKGQMEPSYTRVNMVPYVRDIVDQFNYLASKKGLTLTVVEEPTIKNGTIEADIDESMFDKVIYNLVSNALKFTSKGNVTVLMGTDDTNLKITVADTGCGIDTEDLEKIFDRFYQVNNPETPKGIGTGIGLHFSRTIVKLHGGSISASQRQDGQTGTIIDVVIPLRQKGVEVREQSLIEKEITPRRETLPFFNVEKHKIHSGKRIVIVDDEQEVNDYLTTELSKHYIVKSCKNGKEAYDYLLKALADGTHVEAVVSDIMMPVWDGLTLCKKIKQNINISHLPVILLTAKHSDNDRNQGLLTGADAYIAKPFDMETLKNTISSIIDNRARIASRIGDVQATKASSNGRGKKQKVELKSSDEQLMERVMKYIDEHISDPQLSVEPMAEVVGLSRVHLHRKLKELTGQSARDFIRNIRLKQAGILLSEKKLNVSDVAYSLGFINLSHFSTAFKEFYGMSPRDYMNEKINNDKTQKNDEEQHN